jgi:hypothetical protein
VIGQSKLQANHLMARSTEIVYNYRLLKQKEVPGKKNMQK